jgi:hypothetical protein
MSASDLSASSASPAFYIDCVEDTMYFYPAIRYGQINHLQDCIGIEGEVYDIVFHHGESLGVVGVSKITMDRDTPYDTRVAIWKKLKRAFCKTFYPDMVSSLDTQDNLHKMTTKALSLPTTITGRGRLDPVEKEWLLHNARMAQELQSQLSYLNNQNSRWMYDLIDVGEKHYKESKRDLEMADIA